MVIFLSKPHQHSKFNPRYKKVTPFHPLQQLKLPIRPPRADSIADLGCPLSLVPSTGASIHHPFYPSLRHCRGQWDLECHDRSQQSSWARLRGHQQGRPVLIQGWHEAPQFGLSDREGKKETHLQVTTLNCRLAENSRKRSERS